MIGYGQEHTCTHGEPPGDCPHGCTTPGSGRFDPLPKEPKTELGYARRLIHVYGDRLRYVPAWRRWLVWDGTRWTRDTTGQAQRWAKAVARAVTSDAMAETDADRRRSAMNMARRGESSAGVAGALTLASTEQPIAVEPAQLDADPFLINCPNGTLDLRTGELRPHDPADMLTMTTRAAYRPGTTGDAWDKFLCRVQPDKPMREYLARLTGHALQGHIVEHLLPIHFGTGRNGKSTFIDAVLHALGDYGAAADPELLTARNFDAHPTGVADLFGLRLAVLHETDAGRRLAEGTVKRLTGGDDIKARRMREDFWSFKPSHTFCMLTNHRPLIAGTDEGIWRRIRLVPWNVVIPEHEKDLDLGERLKLDADAVLAWLVTGYQDWRARGLADPDQVANATADYRNESDAVGRFVGECCITGPHFHVRSSELYETWRQWCAREGEEPGTAKAFTTGLQNRGFDTRRTKVGALWDGIGLVTDSDEGDRND